MAIWNSRFKKSFDKSALKFSSSIDIDGKLFNEDIDGSKAHVKMLMKQKIVSTSDGNSILKALEEIRNEISNGKLKFDWQKEDIHSLIEERLVEKIGERGKRLHTARSRNDQIALDERLYLRNEIKNLLKLISDFQKVLQKCLDALPEQWNMCVKLKYLTEKSGEEICQELNIAPTNYWQIVHRAKLQLRNCVENNWFKN